MKIAKRRKSQIIVFIFAQEQSALIIITVDSINAYALLHFHDRSQQNHVAY